MGLFTCEQTTKQAQARQSHALKLGYLWLSRFATNLVLFPVRMTSVAATAVFDKDLAEPPNTTAAQIQVKFHDVQWFKGWTESHIQ